MRKVSYDLVAFVIAMGFFCNQLALAQLTLSGIAWEKKFPDSIDEYVITSSGALLVRSGKALSALDGKDGRELWQKQFPDSINKYAITSSGVLLVRSGKTLFGLDGTDGKELWSLKGLNIGSGKGRENLLEIPNTPVFLSIRDAPGGSSQKPSGMLVAIDMRSGKVLCQLQGITNLYDLIPLHERERILLITGPDPELFGLLFKPQLHFLHMLKGDPVKSQQFVQTSFGILPSCPAEWQVKYSSNYLQVKFREIGGQLYASFRGALVQLDLQTGKHAWGFNGAAIRDFAEGKILMAGKKDVSALDPHSGKPIWTVKDFDAAALAVEQGTVFGTGKKGAFALDLATGSVRWQVESDGPAGDFELFKESHLLVFTKKSGLVVVDADSGKVLQRIGVERPRVPLFALLPLPGLSVSVERLFSLPKLPVGLMVGSHFLLAPTAKGFTLFDLSTGNELWSEPSPDKLSGFAVLRSPAGNIAAYATKIGKNEWKLWTIVPSTGERREWVLNGEQPEVRFAFGLAYTFAGDTLRAFQLPPGRSLPI